MVSSEETADHNVPSDILEKRVSPHSDITESQEIHDAKIPSSKPREETSVPSVVARNEVKVSDAIVCAFKSDQDGSTHSIVQLEKPLQSGHDSPSIIREKVSKDGYNWRKYGQKHVKGNEFIRSYYKCTHPNCQAKKQLEQSNDGQITDSITIGQHNHPRPQLNITKTVDPVLPVVEEKPDKSSSANVEDKAPVQHECVPEQIKSSDSLQISNVSPTEEMKAAHLPLNRAHNEVHSNEDPDPKRLKRENRNVDETGVEKSTSDSRVVVKTSSEVDFVNDGYRWRKYGQKLVKGNINPRSYYRCSSPGCPVKKHVERASHDPKIVITTYEGQHDHGIPLGRTVTLTHNPATNANTMTNNGKPGIKSGGSTVCIDTRERSCLDSESRSNEQPNHDSVPKSEAGDKVEFRATSLHSEDPVSKLNLQEQQNENSGAKEDSLNNNTTCQSSSEVPCRSNEEMKDKVEAKPEGSKDCLNVVAIHDTPGPESELNKQTTSDAEAVKS